MKKLMTAMAALAVFAVAAPAMAQPYGYGDQSWGQGDRGDHQGGGYGLRDRIDKAQRMIQRGERNGSLSRYEVRGFERGLRDIEQRLDFYRRDGMLDPRERRDVDQRLDRMTGLIEQARHEDRGGERDYGRRDGEGWRR